LQKIKVEGKVEKLLEQQNLHDNPWITLITEPIDYVNRQLERNQYFFSDIKKEGVLLYDDGKISLAEAKDLSQSERREIARDNYDYWFHRGCGFLDGVEFYAFHKNEYSIAAFILHQATESLYNAVLLVFTNYKLKSHDIKKLGGMSKKYHEDLLKIFPFDTPERIKCFDLLRSAYIDARYNKNYSITKEQLQYLIERVEKLKAVTEKICLDKIKL
jgi:HEPN domain-containing protein